MSPENEKKKLKPMNSQTKVKDAKEISTNSGPVTLKKMPTIQEGLEDSPNDNAPQMLEQCRKTDTQSTVYLANLIQDEKILRENNLRMFKYLLITSILYN